jgi:peptidoglycan hydrolase CwlO-like protein
MKKKIINGFLMAAMLFTATTSFVSCKDNVDDELVAVYSNLAKVENALKERLTTLEGKLATLQTQVEQNKTDIANMKTDISNIKTQITNLQTEITNIKTQLTEINTKIEALDGRVTELETKLEALTTRVDDLENKMVEMENRIYEAINSIITDVAVNNTINRVIGTWNTPGLNIKALAAFYGENVTSITKFPTTGTSRNVYPEEVENQVFADEILETHKFSKEEIITDEEYNAGKVYFTVNYPGMAKGNFDISGFELTLEDSQGKTAPVTLTNVKPSNYLIHWGFFKSQTPYMFPTEKTEANTNGFFEADANIAIKDLHSASFGTKTFFNFDELKDNLKQAVENIKNANGALNKGIQIGKEAAQMLKNIYSNHMSDNHQNQFNPTYHPQRLVMTKTVGDQTYRAQTADIDMVCTAVKPLSYNAFYELETKAAKHVSFTKLEKAISKFAKKIQSKIPTIDISKINFKKVETPNLTKTINVGGVDYVCKPIIQTRLASDTYPGWRVIYTDGNGNNFYNVTGQYIALEDDIVAPLVDAINNGMDFDTLSGLLQNLGKVNQLGTAVGDAATRVNNAIEKFGNLIVKALNTHQLTRALAPCIFFESAEGIARMQEGLTVKNGMMTIYMSSPTEELLAPAFKKYLAVKKNGKTVFGKIFDGSAQLYTLDLTQVGEYEIILSCVDYYGYICTKKYTLTVC